MGAEGVGWVHEFYFFPFTLKLKYMLISHFVAVFLKYFEHVCM